MSALGEERALVVGAGSLGTVYGAALARAGADVQLLAREEHARAIQERGAVVVDSFGERWEVPLRADWRPERIEPAEIVVLLTKTPDTTSALASLAHVRDAVRIAVSFQNGVAKDDELAGWSGAGSVVGAVAMVGGTLEAPGPRAPHDERARRSSASWTARAARGSTGSPRCSRRAGCHRS